MVVFNYNYDRSRIIKSSIVNQLLLLEYLFRFMIGETLGKFMRYMRWLSWKSAYFK